MLKRFTTLEITNFAFILIYIVVINQLNSDIFNEVKW
jgi:hypothetical protein